MTISPWQVVKKKGRGGEGRTGTLAQSTACENKKNSAQANKKKQNLTEEKTSMDTT